MPTRASIRTVQSNKKPASEKAPLLKKASRGARTTILHLAPSLMPGDPARETVDLAVLTQRAGWRALIVSSGGLLVNEAERAAVRHTRMPLNKEGIFANWRNRAHLEALIQKEKPALIHAHGPSAIAHAIGICRARHLPLLADLTQPVADKPHTHKFLKRLGKAEGVLRVPSDYMARHLESVFHLDAESIHVLPPGIDLKWYDAGATSPERLSALNRLWRLPEQASVILMPLPLKPGSGHKELLQALAHLKRSDIYAVLVGNDSASPGMREEIEGLVSKFGLNGKVIMPEHCTDWPAACWLASAIVAPNTEPGGQILELLAAQAVGRPVIVSSCGANPEMVLSGETAWIVPPNDVKSLAKALSEATALDTRARLDLAYRTREFAAAAFPQNAWFEGMMGLYEAMLVPSKRQAKAA